MWGIIKFAAAKVGAHWDFISSVFGWAWTIGGGALTGWAAWAADIFPAYAPFSWISAGVVGALLFSIILWIYYRVKLIIIMSDLMGRWKKPGDGVNPLDDTFTKRRISVADLTSPMSRIIEGKTFDRCELIGPVTIVLHGANMHNPQFFDSNFVCVKENFPVHHITVLKNCAFINCKMFGFTLMVPESATGMLPGVQWVSQIPSEFSLAELPATQGSPR